MFDFVQPGPELANKNTYKAVLNITMAAVSKRRPLCSEVYRGRPEIRSCILSSCPRSEAGSRSERCAGISARTSCCRRAPEADDTDLKLSEIIIISAQSQPNNDALTKDVQTTVDGLLKRNPNGWQSHKLSGDLAMLATTAEAPPQEMLKMRSSSAPISAIMMPLAYDRKTATVITLALETGRGW